MTLRPAPPSPGGRSPTRGPGDLGSEPVALPAARIPGIASIEPAPPAMSSEKPKASHHVVPNQPLFETKGLPQVHRKGASAEVTPKIAPRLSILYLPAPLLAAYCMLPLAKLFAERDRENQLLPCCCACHLSKPAWRLST